MASTISEDDSQSDLSGVFRLNFHPDILPIVHPKIYRGNDTQSGAMDSRRVLFYHLPPSTTALQVARAAAAFGQVLCVHTVSPQAMMVEFAQSESSLLCQQAVKFSSPDFLLQKQGMPKIEVWIVFTPSYPIASIIDGALQQGRTRTISISPIAADCVWFMIRAIAAPRDILDAKYDEETRMLVLEFASVFAADCAVGQLSNHSFDFVFCGELDNLEFSVCADQIDCRGNETVLPPDHLQQQFDRRPFNNYWPTRYYCAMAARHLHPRDVKEGRDSSASDETATDDGSVNTASTVRTSFEDEPRGRRPFRQDASSVKRQEQEPKELLANVDDAPLPGIWDEFFQNRLTISLRGWAAYGRIAKHRRDLAVQQGRADGIVPQCDGSCELGCKALKETPRPDAVDDFLAMPQEDLLIDV